MLPVMTVPRAPELVTVVAAKIAKLAALPREGATAPARAWLTSETLATNTKRRERGDMKELEGERREKRKEKKDKGEGMRRREKEREEERASERKKGKQGLKRMQVSE